MKSNDIPITRAEEEQFYGKEVTEHDIHCAVRDQLQALDADDCGAVAAEFGKGILEALRDSNVLPENVAKAIGALMITELHALAQRRADIVLYGKVQS